MAVRIRKRCQHHVLSFFQSIGTEGESLTETCLESHSLNVFVAQSHGLVSLSALFHHPRLILMSVPVFDDSWLRSSTVSFPLYLE